MAVEIGDCFYGSATVGERGQIVIPSEARTQLNIKPGDKLLLMKHPIYEGLMVAKLEAMLGFFEEFAQMLQGIKEEGGAE
ncbi:MAG: AbrB/MazE/SpoVT family DNA-binding domain-containing protein [Armatimonadetes bacterium]|nr:AbrB/MazE/SpoVT family DNA-binding domain-containing protein [Armatimonadota bacterium]